VGERLAEAAGADLPRLRDGHPVTGLPRRRPAEPLKLAAPRPAQEQRRMEGPRLSPVDENRQEFVRRRATARLAVAR
jgi:hypothetical protein